MPTSGVCRRKRQVGADDFVPVYVVCVASRSPFLPNSLFVELAALMSLRDIPENVLANADFGSIGSVIGRFADEKASRSVLVATGVRNDLLATTVLAF